MPILEQPNGNPELALFYCRLLRQLRSIGPESVIRQMIQNDLGPVTSSVFNPGSADNLRWYYGGTAARKILLIDGIVTMQHAAALVNGYAPRELGLFDRSINDWMDRQARIIFTALANENISRQEHLDIVGHSAGGAVGLVLANQLLNYEFRPKMKINTFGAPRSGNLTFQNRLAGLSISRWMMSADPIPLMPLRLNDAPQIAILLNVSTVRAWANFVHVQGGICINPDNTTTPATLPALASAAPVSSIVGWLFGIEDNPSNAHSLTSYASAFEAMVASARAPQQVVVEDAPREHSTNTPTQEINQARRERTDAIFEQAERQTEQPIFTPDITLFKAFRQGRVWYVGFGDEVVMTSGHEKRARHIARAGNDFLRSLQKQAVVDPETMLEQFRIFLVLAQDPSTGFRPTINTQQPQ